MSAGSSAVGDSPISLPAVSPSSIEVVPSSSENRMRLAGRSQDIVGSAPGASGGSSPPTLISGEATATATGTAIARRKPVPSLVPPPVLVTAVGSEMEKDWGANGNQDVSSSALPPPLPSAPLPSPNRAYLSPSDAEGGKRWSGSYSDDTLAVMEEQRRKRAVLHRRHQHDDVEDPVEDDGTPELDLDPDSEEKGGVEVEGGLKGADDIIPFPAKPDSLGYPPSTTQRQLLQATGASAKRRREQVRDSTYTNGTKNTKGNAFKGCTSPLRPFSLCFILLFVTYSFACCISRIRTAIREGLIKTLTTLWRRAISVEGYDADIVYLV